jgi:hypothetical protein
VSGVRFDLNSPHRRNHVLEAGEQHCCSKMHDLIWLLGIALGCLAGGEIREPGLIKLELHEPRDGQLVVIEIKAALERVRPVLEAVAREMNEAGRLDPFGYPLYCCLRRNGLDGMSKVHRGGCRFHTFQLFLDVPQFAQARVFGRVLAYEEHVDVGGPDRWDLCLSPEQSRDSRSVRRDDVVRAALSIGQGS